MAAGFLIDTNIFLEILLEQDRWKLCERTLEEHLGDSAMTDFAFHSIGVALFGMRKEVIYRRFLQDVLPRNDLLSLPTDHYHRVITIHETQRLSFDDSYQLAVAEYYSLSLISLDQHFRGIHSPSNIMLLR